MTVLLRFAGPLQSWGTSEFISRGTELVPTRSGVEGLLAACLGARDHRLTELTALTRVEAPGQAVEDFHTVSDPKPGLAAHRHRYAAFRTGDTPTAVTRRTIPSGNGRQWGGATLVTRRRYLADAEFLVAISHWSPDFEAELSAVTREPVFMPYLGRKSCSPVFPFWFGLHDELPSELLAHLPTWRSAGHMQPTYVITGDTPNRAEYVLAPEATSAVDAWEGCRPCGT